MRAFNAFLSDIYGDGEISRDQEMPTELVVTARHFTRQISGIAVPQDLWVHVRVRVGRRTGHRRIVEGFEGQHRPPSGVSYVLENRAAMMPALPELFGRHRVRPVDPYPQLLLDLSRSIAPRSDTDPTVLLLTPGSFSSAYFEHTFLARWIGVEIVEGNDLFVEDAVVYMKTTRGPQRVDGIYRRVDDDFLDPLDFRHDSLLGVTGLLTSYRAGNVGIANGVGTGVADDKAVFPYVPGCC